VPAANSLDGDGHDRDGDDRQDHDREVLADDRDVAEEEAGQHEQPDPENRSHHIVGEESAVAHRPDPGHERREGADDRNEPRQDDRLAAVLLVERVRAVEVLLLEKPDVPLECPRADRGADPVVHRVAQDRRNGEQQHHHPHIQVAERGERARREQQRVPRQERRDHQSRLAEHDEEQDQIRPGPVLGNDLAQVGVEVQKEVDELLHPFHAGSP
jgi:hypothetical protein